MDECEWRPVAGYEGLYEVSDSGLVRSLDRTVGSRYGLRKIKGRVLQPGRSGRGRPQVRLQRDGQADWRFVHHLVLETFVGPRPDGKEACHSNGDQLDNRLVNLRWDTRSSNVLDSVQHGTHLNARKQVCPKCGGEYAQFKRQRVCRQCDNRRNREKYASRRSV